MRRALSVLYASAMLSAVAGCGTMTGSNPYPASSWAQLDPSRNADGCPNLSGTYSNAGDASFPVEQGQPPSLTDIFARLGQAGDPLLPREGAQDWTIPRDADVVTISQTPERLTVSFIDQQDIVQTLRFRRYHFDLSETRYDDLFTCYAGDDAARLRFFPEIGRTVGASDISASAGATLVFLLRGADSSLVVQLRSEAVVLSLVGVGSYAGLSSIWHRYPAASGH